MSRSPLEPVAPATKLHVPRARKGLVPREDLVAFLAEADDRKLTLVEAPAGWGKTTLLAEWHASAGERRPFAWISLDRGDNDAVRFWDTVVAALGTVWPGIGEAVPAALRVRGASASEVALPLLVNDAAASGTAVVLVIDDYHLISNPEIHEGVEFLLDNLPPTLHLAVSTRSEPPLPLGRLRVEGTIAEVRPAQLRFSTQEAEALLNEALALGLDPADVELLVGRTEGWIAGLQLAALSLRDEADPHAFIEQFAGDDRQIVDYLASEVLNRQAGAVRRFMIATSVLDRLCGPLCDAVTGEAGGTEMLERIERANLFLVPLDARRVWYRYHHLFGQLLRHELRRTSPELVRDLHRRAFAWHADHGELADAIHHATAAGDVAEAADLIAANWFAYSNLGRVETVVGWLDELPEETVVADGRLCIARALTSYLLGRLDEVDRWLSHAERSDFEGPMPDGTASSVESGVSTVRAAHRYFTGDVGAAIASATRVVELETEGHAFLNNARGLLGGSYFWSGDRERASETLQEVLRRGRPGVDTIAMLHALGALAALQLERGDLREADRLSAEAVALAEQQGLARHFAASLAFTCRGRVLLAQGDGAAAEEAIRRGIEVGRGAGRLFTAYGLMALAEALRAGGDQDAAREAIAAARETVAACPDPGRLGELVERSARGLGATAPAAVAAGTDLSERELEVLRLLPGTLSQREIAAELYVSINTVKTHTRSIFRKLDASNRDEAVARAHERGLL